MFNSYESEEEVMKNALKYTQFIAAIIAVLSLSSISANTLADEGVIRGKISFGLANYVAPQSGGDIKSNYSSLGVGATYIWPSNTFVDFTTRRSILDATYSAGSRSGDFSRTENILTVGMPLDGGMLGNAGIFNAETTNKVASSAASQKIIGVSVGIGKGFLIEGGKSGVVGVNGGVALLNATNTSLSGVSSSSNLSYGLSVGATYNYVINKTWSVSADGKFQSYLIKYSSFSGDERIISLAASLIGQF